MCALALPGRAFACSHDDSNYFETFVDTSCLQQVKSGKRWKVLAPVKTTKRSAFQAVRTLARGHKYSFRAKTKGYPGLLSGTSRTVTLRK